MLSLCLRLGGCLRPFQVLSWPWDTARLCLTAPDQPPPAPEFRAWCLTSPSSTHRYFSFLGLSWTTHLVTQLAKSPPLHSFQSVAKVSKVLFFFPGKMIRSCSSCTDLSSLLHRGPRHPELKHRIRLLQDMSQHLPIYSQNLRQGLLLPFPLSRIWGTHPTLGHRDRVLAASLQPQLGPVQTTLPFYLTSVHCTPVLSVPALLCLSGGTNEIQ